MISHKAKHTSRAATSAIQDTIAFLLLQSDCHIRRHIAVSLSSLSPFTTPPCFIAFYFQTVYVPRPITSTTPVDSPSLEQNAKNPCQISPPNRLPIFHHIHRSYITPTVPREKKRNPATTICTSLPPLSLPPLIQSLRLFPWAQNGAKKTYTEATRTPLFSYMYVNKT